jgi:nucleoside-diphosphate-sugar epimerase
MATRARDVRASPESLDKYALLKRLEDRPPQTCPESQSSPALPMVTAEEGCRTAARITRDDAGNLTMLGSGQQHWSTVHVADLAHFFRLVVEQDSARARYVIGDGQNPTVAVLTEAAAVAAGAPGAVPGSDDEPKARLGEYFAEVLLLDQGTVAAKARAELGWAPSHPGLPEEFHDGTYPKLATG